jgi:NAD(P)-dependent dehydrogenase (short-subunit alcohol dehydrogenase family)
MREDSRFRYEGKRAIVVGGATGMGAATAQTVAALGGEVVVMDRVAVDHPVGDVVEVDLGDRAAVEAALDHVAGPVDALFNAAGIAGGPGLMRINFIAHRHIIERLLADGRLVRGSAVCMVSSVAGIGWQANLPQLLDFLATSDYDAADAWVRSHEGTDGYLFSKQAMNCYVAREAYPLLAQGIRINAICPGPTDTPLARANADVWLTAGQDYRDATGTSYLTPGQMADTMVFLNSDAASGISGVNLLVDAGYVMSSVTGSFKPGKALVDALMRPH